MTGRESVSFASLKSPSATSVYGPSTKQECDRCAGLPYGPAAFEPCSGVPASVSSVRAGSREVQYHIPGAARGFRVPAMRSLPSRCRNDGPEPAGDRDPAPLPPSFVRLSAVPKSGAPGWYPRHRCGAAALPVSTLRCCRSHNEEPRWPHLQLVFR